MGTVLAVLFSGIALALAGVVPAGAATLIHVDNGSSTCSDTGPGSSSTPLCTISAGTARARAGDTVVVSSGIYGEQVRLTNSGTATARILVTAAAGASVYVGGLVNGFDVANRDWITIRGFNVVNTTSHGINVTDSSNIVVEGNDVSGAGTPALGLTARGISLGTTTNSIVRANFTHDNSDAGIFIGNLGSSANTVTQNRSWKNAQGYTRAAAGIDVRGASSTVTRNVSFANEDSGINVWNGAHVSIVANNVVYGNGDHGIDLKSSTQVKILSNSINDSIATGIEVFNSADAVLANNIIADTGVDNTGDDGNIFVDSVSAATISLDYDLLYLSAPGVMVNYAGQEYSSLAAFRTATGKELHGIQANPRFRDPSVGNLRLSAGSPAIDSANSGVAGHPLTDADGKPRYDDPDTTNTGAGPRLYDDRGAYEFAPK